MRRRGVCAVVRMVRELGPTAGGTRGRAAGSRGFGARHPPLPPCPWLMGREGLGGGTSEAVLSPTASTSCRRPPDLGCGCIPLAGDRDQVTPTGMPCGTGPVLAAEQPGAGKSLRRGLRPLHSHDGRGQQWREGVQSSRLWARVRRGGGEPTLLQHERLSSRTCGVGRKEVRWSRQSSAAC